MAIQSKVEDAVNAGLDALKEVLSADSPSKEQIVKARLGASLFSSAVRHQATQNAMISLRFRVAERILKSSKERKAYLRVSSPELKLLK